MSRPLLELFPALGRELPWARLAELPTPVESLTSVLARFPGSGVDAWVKRDDLTSPIYGGNKVRTLEPLLGEARALGATHVYATGAYGSNHALASVLHSQRLGFTPGAILFSQPFSDTAAANLQALFGQEAQLVDAVHWSALPFAMVRVLVGGRRRGTRPYVMPPGGATPRGGVGYVSAALELAQQVERGELPRPSTIVLPVGSTCTSAGLLAGTQLAAELGIGFVDVSNRPAPPIIRSVRVTPWPITSAWRISKLASRILDFLARASGRPGIVRSARDLRRYLRVDGDQLGRGYGYATDAGRAAAAVFKAGSDVQLDTTYSAKAAAGLIECLGGTDLECEGPFLFWSTKSSAPLPVGDATRREPPRRMERWLRSGSSSTVTK